jgi:hypothetical protein
MPNPREEAESIVNALFEDFGTGGYGDGPVPHIDGYGAIQEMRDDGFPGWRDVEWAGFHIKYLVQNECRRKLPEILPYDQERRHLVKGRYVWDSRFNANEEEEVILGDVQEYDTIVRENNGIGILVVDAYASYDFDGEFRRWHERLKGGSTPYTALREAEGRHPRLRKDAYMIRKVRSYFFTSDDLRDGVRDSWLDATFQEGLRNADGSPRNPKYRFRIGDVPNRYLLFIKNFNEDSVEFAEEYPEFS